MDPMGGNYHDFIQNSNSLIPPPPSCCQTRVVPGTLLRDECGFHAGSCLACFLCSMILSVSLLLKDIYAS